MSVLLRKPTPFIYAPSVPALRAIGNAAGTATGYNGTTVTLTTPDGTGQATHPDVAYFPSKFAGARYWMAVTPFAAGAEAQENPSIVCSVDGLTWTVPPGLTNPIDPYPTPATNSDTDFVLGNDGLLYCVYREGSSSSSAHGDIIKIRSSHDGITWSAETTILTATVSAALSPTVIWDGTQYVMWSTKSNDPILLGGSDTTLSLERRTCSTMTGTWSAPTTCTMNAMVSRYPWHIDVFQAEGKYWMINNDTRANGADKGISIGVSSDGLTWDFTPPLIRPGSGGFDDAQPYRGTGYITPNRNVLRLWYGGQNTTSGVVWRCGYVEIPTFELPKYTPPGYVLIDNFNKVPSTTSMGTASNGAAWTVQTSGAVYGIDGNGATAVRNGMALQVTAATQSTVVVDSGVSDCEVGVTLVDVGDKGICFRSTDDSNNFITNQTTLFKRVAGSFTNLGTFSSSLVAGDILSVVLSGSSITVKRNGSTILSVTETFNQTATKHGLRQGGNFDNFYVK